MGFEHRLKRAHTVLLRSGACIALTAATACSSAPKQEEQRKAVLTPQDIAQKQREAFEKLRVETVSGELIESDIKVAGIVMPRGMTTSFAFEHEWTLDAPLRLAAVETYFRKRLDIAEETHPLNGTTEWNAHAKDTPGGNRLTIQVSPQPGRQENTRVHITEFAPPKRVLTQAQIQAEMAEKAKRTWE